VPLVPVVEVLPWKRNCGLESSFRNSGRPHTLTLWTKPQDNPELTKAIKQNRALSVIQQPGKRDYGVLGFELHPGALYLIFPKPLPREENARVIGINFQLVEEPAVNAVQRAKKTNPLPKRENPKPVIHEPKTRKFAVKVRRTAGLESEVSVHAPNKEAAKRQALEAAKEKPFKFKVSQAKVHVDVVKTEPSFRD